MYGFLLESVIKCIKAEFGQSIVDRFKKTSTIWVDDATYKDVSGSATFTKVELSNLDALLERVEKLFSKINNKVITDIQADKELLELIKIYNNSKIKDGEKIKSCGPVNLLKKSSEFILKIGRLIFSSNFSSF